MAVCSCTRVHWSAVTIYSFEPISAMSTLAQYWQTLSGTALCKYDGTSIHGALVQYIKVQHMNLQNRAVAIRQVQISIYSTFCVIIAAPFCQKTICTFWRFARTNLQTGLHYCVVTFLIMHIPVSFTFQLTYDTVGRTLGGWNVGTMMGQLGVGMKGGLGWGEALQYHWLTDATIKLHAWGLWNVKCVVYSLTSRKYTTLLGSMAYCKSFLTWFVCSISTILGTNGLNSADVLLSNKQTNKRTCMMSDNDLILSVSFWQTDLIVCASVRTSLMHTNRNWECHNAVFFSHFDPL